MLKQFINKHPLLTILSMIALAIPLIGISNIIIYSFSHPQLEISLTPIIQPYGERGYYKYYAAPEEFPSHRTYDLNYMPYYYLLTIKNTGKKYDGTIQISKLEKDETAFSHVIPFSVNKDSTYKQLIPSSCALKIDHIEYLHNRYYKINYNNQESSICMGILGKSADALIKSTFDKHTCNADEINYPLHSISLDPATLKENLPALTFLMIDNFDTSTLSKDLMNDIENWTYNGGILILGGGTPVSKNISGLSKDFFPIFCEVYLEKEDILELCDSDYPYSDTPYSTPAGHWFLDRNFFVPGFLSHYRSSSRSAGCCVLLHFSPSETFALRNNNSKDPSLTRKQFSADMYNMLDSLYYFNNILADGPDR